MTPDITTLIRSHAAPSSPLPTSVEPRLLPLPDIQCVLFDIYGTLFQSGSGDVGLTVAGNREQGMLQALQAEGVEPPTGVQLPEQMDRLIHEHHRKAKEGGFV